MIPNRHTSAEITTRSPLDPICPLVSSQTGTPARLLARTNLEMSRPLRSTPITGASPLLRAGPPASAATVLNASGYRRQRAPSRHPPSTSPTGRQAVSAPAFPRSVQEPQTGLAPPKRRTPPGQYSGTRQAHPGNSWPPRFRCHLHVSTRQQRFAHARLPDPHLTPQPVPFPHRSPRRSSANAACGGLTPPPEGRRRRATKPSSPAQHRIKGIRYSDPFPALVAHRRSNLVEDLHRGGMRPCRMPATSSAVGAVSLTDRRLRSGLLTAPEWSD